jgi:phospholipid/cholesterol/gamma-HCH transport system substrate-binding protein
MSYFFKEARMFDIKKQIMWSKLKVGLVITTTLAILFIAVFFAGSIERLFQPRVEITALIQDVQGLRTGAPVWVSGIEIGSVNKISLHPEHGTVVTMSINKDALNFLRTDSYAYVMTIGLLGDKYIELSAGSPEAKPLRPGDVVKGAARIGIKDIMEASAASIQQITAFIDKLEDVIAQFEKAEGTVAKFLTDPSVYNNIEAVTKSLAVVVDDINKQRGTLGLLLKDPTLYNSLVSTTSRIDGLSNKLDEGADRMIAAASSIEEFGKKLNDSRGTLHKLIEDEELYNNLNKASQRLNSILASIDSGEGTAGALLKDEELAIELKKTIVELKETTSAFRSLINDIQSDPDKYFKFSIF